MGLVFGLKKKPPHQNCLANLLDGTQSQANYLLCNVPYIIVILTATHPQSRVKGEYGKRCCDVFKSFGCTTDDIPSCAGGKSPPKFTPSPFCRGPS